MALLTKEQMLIERLRSMCVTFARADSVFFGGRIKVHAVDQQGIQAPGYSTESDIYLNVPYIGTVDSTDDVIKVTGLNFHELAHCMFTPGQRTATGATITQRGLNRYFNMLEDQRIESMLSAEFNPMKPYFVMTIMKYIANTTDPQALGTAHALTYGRKFLPDNVRTLLRDRWAEPAVLADLERIIDDYRTVVYPRDSAKGIRLVEEYANLLKRAFGQQHVIGDPYGHDSDTRPGSGSNATSQRKQEQAQQAMGEGGDDPDDEEATGDSDGDMDGDGAEGDGTDGSGSGDGADGDADGDGDGSGDGDGDSDADGLGGSGSGKSDKPGRKSGQSGEQDGDGNGGGGAGYGPGTGSAPEELSDDAIRDELNRVAKQQEERADVQRDAQIKRDAIKATTGQLPVLDQEDFTLRDVEVDYAMAATGFKKQLMKLWADADPGWDRYKSSGRLNIGRVMRGDDPEQVFDQWNPGKNDATSIELALLCDYSGSMSGSMWQVSQSMWAIKRAIESIGGEVTVYGFESDSMVFYNKQDKAHPTMCRAFRSQGGTDPVDALEATMVLMHYSKKVHRFCVILTDGAWSYSSQSCDDMIRQMNAHGIITALGYIGGTYGTNAHGCQVATDLTSGLDLLELAKGLVKEGMKVPV